SFLTSAAVKFAMTVLGFPSEMESLVCFRGAVDPPTQGCRPVALTAGRQGEKWLLAGLGSLDRGVDGRLAGFGSLGRGVDGRLARVGLAGGLCGNLGVRGLLRGFVRSGGGGGLGRVGRGRGGGALGRGGVVALDRKSVV